MAKLSNDWSNAFESHFDTDEEVVEFIFENLSLDFEDSYEQMGNGGDTSTMVKHTAEEKEQTVYDFLIYLAERINKKGE